MTRPPWRRVLDWLLYLAIAVGLVVALWIAAVHKVNTGGTSELPFKWIGFAGMTAIVFGYAAQGGLRERSGPKFWNLLGIALVVHTAVGVGILVRVTKVPLVYYGLLTGVEYVALLFYLDSFLGSDPKYR